MGYHWWLPLGHVVNDKIPLFNQFPRLVVRALPQKIYWDVSPRNLLAINQHRFGKWLLYAVRQQTITWTNVVQDMLQIMVKTSPQWVNMFLNCMRLKNNFTNMAMHFFDWATCGPWKCSMGLWQNLSQTVCHLSVGYCKKTPWIQVSGKTGKHCLNYYSETMSPCLCVDPPYTI